MTSLLPRLILLPFLASLFLAPSPAAADPKGEELMRKVDAATRTQGEHLSVRMDIKGGPGGNRVRRFDMFLKAPAGQVARSLVVFREPADVARTGVLTSDDGKNRQQWVYVPSTGKTRRIASTDRTESFVGSDFTLEDLKLQSDFIARSYDWVRDETWQGVACSVVKDSPRTDAEKQASGYKEVLLWVDAARSLVWRVDFYDKRGSLKKQLIAEDLKQYGALFRHDRAVMTDLSDGSVTTMQAESRQVNQNLSDGKFAPGALPNH